MRQQLTTASLILMTIIGACNSNPENQLPNKNLISVESDDIEINKAISKAKQSFSQFDTAFKNGNFNRKDFFIKVRFSSGESGEHIWTNQIAFEKGNYYGLLTEDPVMDLGIKMGDKIRINKAEISDWMYFSGDEQIGGFTTEALKARK